MAKIKLDGGGTVEMKVDDLHGRKVRTLREMSNGNYHIPAGTIVEVSGTWRSGVSLKSPACGHCGVAVYISHVHRDSVALVNEPPAPSVPTT
jgi:hypothetical protein